MKMKKGFTLAEVLVVLFILGVIGALMMVSLNKSRPDEDMLMYRKAFFSLQEAASNLVNDMNLYPNENLLERVSTTNVPTTNTPTDLCNDLLEAFASVNTVCSDIIHEGTQLGFKAANNVVYLMPNNIASTDTSWVIKVVLPSDEEKVMNLATVGKVFVTSANTSETAALQKTKVTK